MMNEIVRRAMAEVERRIEQAVTAERQRRMTRTMCLLNDWGFSHARVAAAIREVFGERFTVPAVKMRVWTARRKPAGSPAAGEPPTGTSAADEGSVRGEEGREAKGEGRPAATPRDPAVETAPGAGRKAIFLKGHPDGLREE